MAHEMLQRLDGTIQYTKEDEERQRRYRELLMRSVYKKGRHDVWYPDCPVGRDFLRQNPWFLE